MHNEVKFIFKTLIKVPVIIAVAYAIFNLFAFCFIYFKVLGVSYVVMQTAVENNYLPASELIMLYDYVDGFNDIDMVENASIIVAVENKSSDTPNYIAMNNRTDTSPTIAGVADAHDARTRVQYGHTVTVGVTADYVFVWPLDYRTTQRDADGNLVSADDSGGYMGQDRTNNNIVIVYDVPGLKYYPDLLS